MWCGDGEEARVWTEWCGDGEERMWTVSGDGERVWTVSGVCNVVDVYIKGCIIICCPT